MIRSRQTWIRLDERETYDTGTNDAKSSRNSRLAGDLLIESSHRARLDEHARKQRDHLSSTKSESARERVFELKSLVNWRPYERGVERCNVRRQAVRGWESSERSGRRARYRAPDP